MSVSVPRGLAMVAVLLVVAGCAADASPSAGTAAVTSTARPATPVCTPGALGNRRAIVCRPDGPANNRPAGLVLALHGRDSTAVEMQAVTRLDEPAAAHHLAVAYVEGLDGGWGDDTFTAPGRPTGHEDVDALDAVVERLRAEPGIDDGPVGVVGFSNGASMALRYAAQRPASVRAVVSVAGQLPRDPAVRPAAPVPLLQIYGTADPIRPFTTGIADRPDRRPGQATPTLSTPETVAAFVAVAGPTTQTGPTTTDPVPDDGTTVRTDRWTTPAGGTVAVLHEIVGGGHAWPSARAPSSNGGRFGVTSRDLDASAEAIIFVSGAGP